MKRKGKLVTKLMGISLISVVATAVILTILAAIQIDRAFEDTITEMLQGQAIALADTYDTAFEGEWIEDEEGNVYKEGVLINGNNELIDEMKKGTGLDYTLIWRDTRIATTLLKEGTNERNVGTQISADVWAKVQKGETVNVRNIVIGGAKYDACYAPLKQPDGTVVGCAFAARTSAVVTNHIRQSILIMVIVAAVIVAVIFIIGIILAKNANRAMVGIVNALEKLSGGNLAVHVDPELLKRNDELGIIAENTTNLSDKLRSVISVTLDLSGNVSESGENLSSSAEQATQASGQVTEAVDDISKGAVSQAESIQVSANNTNDIGNDIEGITANIDELTEYANRMKDACDSAMDALNQLLKQNENVVSSMQVIDSQIRATNDAVKDISQASEIITDISSQTNLLSLNASIEAARAGEAGKGFAVVATEIGSLATQSGEAAVKINDVVKNLVAESEKSVKTIEELNQEFEAQSQQLDQTRNDMTSMADGVQNVTDSSVMIADKVQNLGRAKNNLMEIIEDLSAISEENAASTQETNASMEELNATFELINTSARDLKSLAVQLNQEMSFFKLSDTDDDSAS